jgi:hypothetical protein
MSLPSGSELARPFVPARDFALSKRFYEALGFEKLLDGDVAIFGIGTNSFNLQNRFEKEWALNFMMQLMVDDLDSWWSHINELDLPARFRVPKPKEPALQPWGLRGCFSGRSLRRPLARSSAAPRQCIRLEADSFLNIH